MFTWQWFNFLTERLSEISVVQDTVCQWYIKANIFTWRNNFLHEAITI